MTIANLLREGNIEGPIENQWKPLELPLYCTETELHPHDFIYGDYRKHMADKGLYKKSANNTEFRGVDRLKLIAGILAGRIKDGGCALDMYDLIKASAIKGFMPLHDGVEVRLLEAKWLVFFQLPWYQNVDAVQDYFGEKIAFYFLWLGHYTGWLMLAAPVGFICWINVAAKNNDPNVVLMPYYAAFMAIWSTCFIEFWKRKEKDNSMKWGTVGFEDEQQARPEFAADSGVTEEPNPVDGGRYLYFPRQEFAKRQLLSTIVSIIFVFLVAGALAAMFAIKFALMAIPATEAYAATIFAIINAVQIQVMGAIYASVSLSLNKYENHRTDIEYEDALIAKTFIVQFINSFASLFFIAFGQPFIYSVHGTNVPMCAQR